MASNSQPVHQSALAEGQAAKAKSESATTASASSAEVTSSLEQNLGKPVSKATPEEIQGAWVDVYGAQPLTEELASELDVKVLDALAPKPSWMTKADQQVSPKDRVIIQQFQTVLGREVDPNGLAHYRSLDMTSEQMAKDLATSREAAKLGVDPTQYGAKAVDAGSLSGNQKQFYDIWRKYNPDATLTDAQVQQFGWAANAGTPAAYEAAQAGEIVNSGYYDPASGSVSAYKIITPKAIDMMGGEIQLKGNDRGEVVLAPADAKWAWGHENWQKVDEQANGLGVYQAKGNPTSSGFSLIGNALGQDAVDFLDQAIPNEQKFFMDPAGIWGSAVFGESFNRDAAQSVAKDTGLSPEDVQFAQHIARSVVEAAVTIVAPPLGVPVTAALEFSAAANSAAQGNVKFGRAVASAAMTTASSAASAYLSPPFALAANAGIRSISGESGDQVFNDFLWDAAGYVVPAHLSTLARPLVDKDVTWEDALVNYGVSAAAEAAAGYNPLSDLGHPIKATKKGAASLFTANPVNEGRVQADRRWFDKHMYTPPDAVGIDGVRA